MTNVLIVEDEQAIRRFLRTALEGDGMRVFEAETLQRGLLEAATRKPDLIILDLGLPDGDGIEFIRDLRQWSAVPVIVLSARSEESDKIAALDAGADDYLSKPFGIGELQARLRVALRRHSATTAPDPLVKFSDVTVDLAARVIHRGEEEVHLTPIEFRLLAVLLKLFERVLINLLENAVKYAGAQAEIGIDAHVEGENLQLDVWDNGPGLPPGQEQTIFDKFARGNKESAVPGVGLGLAICRAIVDVHGGTITAFNRPEGGACFRVTLPQQTAPELEEFHEDM